jgi:hypothetical protein
MGEANGITCGQCDTPIVGELVSLERSQRGPCPNCGSTDRNYRIVAQMPVSSELSATTSATATVPLEVIDYPRKFLDVAQTLIEGGQFEMAVVAAHVACEIATEQALSKAFDALKNQDLKDAVTDLLNGYNLGNSKIRKVYTALTRDKVAEALFWSAFKASAKRRNHIIHKGLTVAKTDAESSYDATSRLVAHLAK